MYNITQFAKLLNYSVKTLQKWDRENILKPETRTKTNRRLYSHDQLMQFTNSNILKKRKNIIYCRVSSSNQKNDLTSQKDFLIDFTRNMGLSIDDIYTDIGSGMNFKRKNFLKLLEEVQNNEIESITIAHKDRLCRFGYELIENILEKYNVKINLINDDRLSPEQELCQDLTSIIHVFSSRLYGLRKYKNRIKKMCENAENEF
jgi:predicted site-specific integrase-resolvase